MGINVYDEVIEVLKPIERIVTEDELCFQVEVKIKNSHTDEESVSVIKEIRLDKIEKYKVGYKYNRKTLVGIIG